MPYIDKDSRREFDNQGNYQHPRNCGELNYIITKIVHRYVAEKGVCYQSYNDAMGALEGCKLELYRKLVSPYEDKKEIENGSI